MEPKNEKPPKMLLDGLNCIHCERHCPLTAVSCLAGDRYAGQKMEEILATPEGQQRKKELLKQLGR